MPPYGRGRVAVYVGRRTWPVRAHLAKTEDRECVSKGGWTVIIAEGRRVQGESCYWELYGALSVVPYRILVSSNKNASGWSSNEIAVLLSTCGRVAAEVAAVAFLAPCCRHLPAPEPDDGSAEGACPSRRIMSTSIRTLSSE